MNVPLILNSLSHGLAAGAYIAAVAVGFVIVGVLGAAIVFGLLRAIVFVFFE